MTTYRPGLDGRAMHIGYLMSCEGKTEAQAIAEADANATYEELLARALVRKCAIEGHRIQDDSYGGPESGCIDLHCTRCGWGHHNTLY